jgi:DNA recombination protein RmuC
MLTSLTPHAAVLIGALAGAALVLVAALIWLPRQAQRRYLDGQQSRDTEVETLAVRLSALQSGLDERTRDLSAERQRLDAAQREIQRQLAENGELRGQAARLAALDETLREREQELATTRKRLEQALTHAKGLETQLREEIKHAHEKLDFSGKLRAEFTDVFKNLASEVLDERSQRLQRDSESQLGALLHPMREQLKSFAEEAQRLHTSEAVDRSALKREIEELKRLNQRFNDEALNLSKALRGDTRVQGAWGELVLTRLLQAAGLSAGREYTEQMALKGDDGSRPRPDVIVHLPQDRDLVIDAKVSLTAYERSTQLAGADRERALDEHAQSLRRHIATLAERDYASLLQGRALDFVLLFVPVESALIEAVRRDPGLYEAALGKNVAIVSPSTLLATLRAVAHLWKLEQRNRNAEAIALQAGKLYDKFVGFVEDLEAARSAIAKGQTQLDQAFNKLKTGRGNLIRQADQLRDMGAKTGKALPPPLVQEALEFGPDPLEGS